MEGMAKLILLIDQFFDTIAAPTEKAAPADQAALDMWGQWHGS